MLRRLLLRDGWTCELYCICFVVVFSVFIIFFWVCFHFLSSLGMSIFHGFLVGSDLN